MPRVTDAAGRPVSGVVNAAVNAIVSDHDDPEGRGRVRVRYPTLDGEPESAWLRVVTPGASGEAGFYALPSVGDEVLVVFLYGSQDHGVVVGAMWNGRNLPPSEGDGGMPAPSGTQIPGAQASTATHSAGSSDNGNNDRRLWRSRSGHLIALDDTGGAESVQIFDGTHTLSIVLDGAGKQLIVANTGGDTHVRTSGKLFLECGGDFKLVAGGKIEVQAGGDTKGTLAGKLDLTVAGDGSAMVGGTTKVLSAGDLGLQSGGTLALKGLSVEATGASTAKLTAGAMVQIQAGLVKIN